MTTEAKIYSTKYNTLKIRGYNEDPIKYKIAKIITVRCSNARYNHEDEEKKITLGNKEKNKIKSITSKRRLKC